MRVCKTAPWRIILPLTQHTLKTAALLPSLADKNKNSQHIISRISSGLRVALLCCDLLSLQPSSLLRSRGGAGFQAARGWCARSERYRDAGRRQIRGGRKLEVSRVRLPAAAPPGPLPQKLLRMCHAPCLPQAGLRPAQPRACRCNGTRDSIKQLVADLNAAPPTTDVEIICSPPFVYLDQVVSTLGKRYGVAAQNSWVAGLGAYTGEIADEMILDVGAAWVILGHSERRALCGETSEMVGKKVQRALSKGCVASPSPDRSALKNACQHPVTAANAAGTRGPPSCFTPPLDATPRLPG